MLLWNRGGPDSGTTSALRCTYRGAQVLITGRTIPFRPFPGNATATAAMEARATALRTAFRAAFLRNGTWDNGVMTAHVLPLALGLPEAEVQGLVAELRAHRDHFTTGILGFRHLFTVLDAHGEADRALAVLLRTDYPSIGYNFANGKEAATTNLWEVWFYGPIAWRERGGGHGPWRRPGGCAGMTDNHRRSPPLREFQETSMN